MVNVKTLRFVAVEVVYETFVAAVDRTAKTHASTHVGGKGVSENPQNMDKYDILAPIASNIEL